MVFRERGCEAGAGVDPRKVLGLRGAVYTVRRNLDGSIAGRGLAQSDLQSFLTLHRDLRQLFSTRQRLIDRAQIPGIGTVGIIDPHAVTAGPPSSAIPAPTLSRNP